MIQLNAFLVCLTEYTDKEGCAAQMLIYSLLARFSGALLSSVQRGLQPRLHPGAPTAVIYGTLYVFALFFQAAGQTLYWLSRDGEWPSLTECPAHQPRVAIQECSVMFPPAHTARQLEVRTEAVVRWTASDGWCHCLGMSTKQIEEARLISPNPN